jgi:hypothetical protein
MEKVPLTVFTTKLQRDLYTISNNEFGEHMLNLQVRFNGGQLGRTAISYWDTLYIDYYEVNDNGYEEVMVQTSHLRIFIEGYGLKKIYEAILSRTLASLDITPEPVENPKEFDVYVRNILTFERGMELSAK